MKKIVFAAPNRAELQEFDSEPVTERKLRLRAAYSLISAGTEGLQFRKLFAEDSHWATFVTYPYVPGYATTGVVEEVGSG